MTVFIRCIEQNEKQCALLSSVRAYREGEDSDLVYRRALTTFEQLPSSSMSYWAPDKAISAFSSMPVLENGKRIARSTNDSGDDTRFVRASWEVDASSYDFVEWRPLCKGGEFSRYYSDVHLKICWNTRRDTYLGFVGSKHRPLEKPASIDLFLRPGLTWSRRTALRLSMRTMPAGCVFAQKGPAIFCEGDDPTELLSTLAISNSSAFFYFVEFQLGAVNAGRAYDMGIIQRTPFPELTRDESSELARLAHEAWSSKRYLDTVTETSPWFLLPSALFERLGIGSLGNIRQRLDTSHSKIEELAFALYGFTEADRAAVFDQGATETEEIEEESSDAHTQDGNGCIAVEEENGLLSWAVGVAFGRFDWRLATGERTAPPEPNPFDPLPKSSPGMLLDKADLFHRHHGILVDDAGHPHDLPHLIEELLVRVDALPQQDVRHWLRRNFFKFHLKQYSKSRRKAPIYWPLSAESCDYTLWVYYPSLSSQTLYTAVNDFIEPKLKQVREELGSLRAKVTDRTRDDEKKFEALQSLEQELIELRDMLLKIAPTFKPNHDDGVQITAALLWRLFRHKPWQKVLNETWTRLETGEYDWAHLAMAYWPDRVREKCKTDKSLAIAHDLEPLYEEPDAESRSSSSRTQAGTR